MATPHSGSENTPGLLAAVNRRSFLSLLGASAGVMALASCTKDDSEEDNRPSIEIGGGQTGLLRLAYALEGLLLEFLDQAIAVRPATETLYKDQLSKMRNFHQAYADLLSNWLGGDVPGPLAYDTTKINLRDRVRMSATGFYLLDVATSAYTGLAERVTDPARAQVLAKMAASCARQSTVFRWNQTTSLWDIRSSSDVISASTGLTAPRTPSQVAGAVDAFLVNKWDTSQL